MRTTAGVGFLEQLDFDYLAHLYHILGPQFSAETSLQEAQDSPIRGSMALLVWQDSIVFVGRLTRGHRSGPRRSIKLELVSKVEPPLPANQLRAALLSTQRRPLQRPGGSLSEKATQRVLDVLMRERPSLTDALSALLAESLPPERPDLRPLAEQRDAVATLLEIARFTPDAALSTDRSWLTGNRRTFLPSTHGITPLEDTMIEHDRGRFLGWEPEETDEIGVRSFTNGAGKELRILNVNRWATETALGCDLIYYNVQHHSYALLQYKRMTSESGEMRYRPDAHFDQQIARMRALDSDCMAQDGSQYRLSPTPSYLKICQLESMQLDKFSVVPGIYLAREQAEIHLNDRDARGDHGGRYFSFKNVQSYMTMSIFTDLLSLGLIGTSGASTEHIREIIDMSLTQRGAAVVGILNDRTMRRPGWKQPAQ
ncbi:hypothetical protein [Kribbella sp. NPDC050459]|uniref:hypothetical protein n=1 Tax=Kribbella sp. NPDC050459 TaxID=3155785 RepID=UPI0033F631BA